MKYDPRIKILALFSIFLFIFAACNTEPNSPATDTVVPSATPSRMPVSSATPTGTPLKAYQIAATQRVEKMTLDAGTATIGPSPTRFPTRTPFQTPPIVTFQAPLPGLAGTPLPDSATISKDNLTRLARVARWGRGSIQGVAIAPGDQSFAVGTRYGIAFYNYTTLGQPPEWFEFENPLVYNSMAYSLDNQYLLLRNFISNQDMFLQDFTPNENPIDTVLRLSDRAWITPPPEIVWTALPSASNEQREITADFPDGLRRFKSWLEWGLSDASSVFDQTKYEVIMGVFDTQDQLIYTLQDTPPLIKYFDFYEPLSCNIDVFNIRSSEDYPLSASRIAPEQIGFSTNGETFALQFASLRVYDSNTGSLLLSKGDIDHWVANFAYSPTSATILIAFKDGDIQLWDIPQKKILFEAWDFVKYPTYLTESYNGEFILIERGDVLEVRRSQDGTLLRRAEMSTFAVSPVENMVAIGHKDGSIDLCDLASGAILQHLTLHQKKIYSLVFSPDGKSLFSSSQDCSTRQWSVINGQQQNWMTQPIVHNRIDDRPSGIFIYFMQFLSGTDQILGIGSLGWVVNWNANTGKINYLIQSDFDDYYNFWPTYPNDLYIDSVNQRIYLDGMTYDLQDGSLVSKAPQTDYSSPCNRSKELTQDGQLRFADGFNELAGDICIFDVQENHHLYSLPVTTVLGYSTETILSQDGKRLYVRDSGGGIYVYQVLP